MFAFVGSFILGAEERKAKLGACELRLGEVDLGILPPVPPLLHDGNQRTGIPGLLTNRLLALLVVVESGESEGGIQGNCLASIFERELGSIQAILCGSNVVPLRNAVGE